MKKTRQLLILFVSMISTTIIHAQEKGEYGKFMRTDGRSYVVVAVMLTILAGLILYIIRVDRKVTKLEREK